MKSLFVTGTDTDIGKTYISAGIVLALKKSGINVGVMKPFMCGTSQKIASLDDVTTLTNAANVNDPRELVNPFFFPIPASPYTAAKNLDVKINIEHVVNSFEKLCEMHDLMLIEGIGGIMTPILKDFAILDLIKKLQTNTIIVTSSKIGTVNHTVMTCEMCKNLEVPIKGLIINNFDSEGYSIPQLERDLHDLTNLPILCSLPHMNNLNLNDLAQTIENRIDLLSLFR
ncbi:ATP-dependent dethiobiotin synthetase BioD protein [Marine Group I thaumarchaeote SCGC AAA799-O18]|jgi:dethiobiotin synthetase|nr:ATP-dependent dethiobiotin synthetase BioD protein [Marine Group I thaumarchaeote SCGC AAA799-O18]